MLGTILEWCSDAEVSAIMNSFSADELMKLLAALEMEANEESLL